MNLPGELAASVRERALDRCQYCLMHQSLQGATFHVEHIIPRSQGGPFELSNLALACPSYNLHKADRTMTIDLRVEPRCDCFIRAGKPGQTTFDLAATGLKD